MKKIIIAAAASIAALSAFQASARDINCNEITAEFTKAKDGADARYSDVQCNVIGSKVTIVATFAKNPATKVVLAEDGSIADPALKKQVLSFVCPLYFYSEDENGSVSLTYIGTDGSRLAYAYGDKKSCADSNN